MSEVLKCKLQTALRQYKKNHLESWYGFFKSPKSKHRYHFICQEVKKLTAKTEPVGTLALVASLLESDSESLKNILSDSVFLTVYSHQNGASVGEDRSGLIHNNWLDKHRVVRTYVSEKYAITKTDTAKTLNKWIKSLIQHFDLSDDFKEKKDHYTQSMRIDGTEREGVEMKLLK